MELKFWGCGVNAHLLVTSGATVAKAFILCALFFQLSDESGSSLAHVYLFSLFMFLHFCIWICLIICECNAYGTDTGLNWVLEDDKIYQSSKLVFIQSNLILILFLFLKDLG